MAKGKVIGIGGMFFLSENPDSLKEWYASHLGMKTDQYGCLFEFRLSERPEVSGHLQWSAFPKDTSYLKPSEKEFMINYRVENLEALLEELKSNGVIALDEVAVYEYGKFVHLMDPEGNKIELWEPADNSFEASE